MAVQTELAFLKSFHSQSNLIIVKQRKYIYIYIYKNDTSLHKNSLMLERKTFRPSADLEYGVSPAPLS